MKIEQLGMLATVVVAFAALAALVLTGQVGIRQDLRALQTDMLGGQAELREEMRAGQAELRKDMRALRAGQVDLRGDLAKLGVRLAVVEHRADAFDSRFEEVERRMVERHVVADTSDAGAASAVSPTGSPPRAIPSR